MKPPKLSKKVNIIVGILLLLIGISIGGYLVLGSKIASLKGNSGQLSEQSSEIAEAGQKDTDGDGLADWQEVLFGTDKDNPDTDGDGYLDGEEVLSYYDPLKPGPNDKLLESSARLGQSKGNLTEYFASQLAEQMDSFGLGLNTNSLLEISAQDILDNLSSKDLTELSAIGLSFVPEQIREEDLKITETTKQSVFDYLTGIEAALSKNENECEDIETFKNALRTGDFSEIKQIAKTYQDNYQDLKILATPSDFSSIHIELLNILLLTKISLENFAQLNQDPVKAYLGLEMYRQAY